MFDIGTGVQVVGVDFGDGKAVAEKMARKFEEGGVFFADVVKDADGFVSRACKSNDLAAGTTEFAMKRDDALGRFVKMLFEEAFQYVHF